MPNLYRRLLQCLLVLPAFLATPLGWTFLIHVLTEDKRWQQTPDHPGWAVHFLASSALGLAGLGCSIFSDPKKAAGKFRWAMVFGLIAGLQLVIVMMLRALAGSRPDYDVLLLGVWMLGGPLFVGCWNLSTLLRPRTGVGRPRLNKKTGLLYR
jgi:hypothetical protein